MENQDREECRVYKKKCVNNSPAFREEFPNNFLNTMELTLELITY